MLQLLVNGQVPSAPGSTSNESGPALPKYRISARPPNESSKSDSRNSSPARAVNAGSSKPLLNCVSSVKVAVQKVVHGSVTVPLPLAPALPLSLLPQPVRASTPASSHNAAQACLDCFIDRD